MINRSLRLFCTLKSLRDLKTQSEKYSLKVFNDFLTKYNQLLAKNPYELGFSTNKLTPIQVERAEMLAEEIVKLNPIQFRVFFYLIQDLGNRNFNYKPEIKAKENLLEELWTQNTWPTAHATNIEFQKELDEYGLLGYHGFPKTFMDKLVSGEIMNND
jgi:hypothetical protein